MRHLRQNSAVASTVSMIAVIMALLAPPSLSAGNTTDLDGLPDPTRPSGRLSGSGNPAGATLVLQSILRSGQRRSAIINGRIKTVGSWINGNQIRDIRQDSVVVARNGRLRVLHLSTIADIKSAVVTQ